MSDAIDQFQAENQEFGLVIENGAVVGLVTVTDAFEAVLGDIEDSLDEETPQAIQVVIPITDALHRCRWRSQTFPV